MNSRGEGGRVGDKVTGGGGSCVGDNAARMEGLGEIRRLRRLAQMGAC